MMKTCTKCGGVKSLEDFNKNRTRSDGRQQHCRVCTKQANTQWGHDNPEQKRDNAARWAAANPERRRAHNARWYAANSEQVCERTSRWKRENADKASAHAAAYRARKVGVSVAPFTRSDLMADWDDNGLYCCIYCEGPVEHIDHCVPLARGGEHSITNSQPTCSGCNLRKGAKDPWVFLAELFGPLEEWLPVR